MSKVPPPLPPRPLPSSPPSRAPTLPPRSPSIRRVFPPLVPGLTDEKLFSLIRRWDKQIRHLRLIPAGDDVEPRGMDLMTSKEEQFSPELLRNNVERVYLTVVLGFLRLQEEVEYVRKWADPLRTGTFASAYFIAWNSRVGVAPLLLVFLALLISSPTFRVFSFPPHPPPPPKPALPSTSASNSVEPELPTEPTATETDEIRASEFAQDVARLANATATVDNSQRNDEQELLEDTIVVAEDLDKLLQSPTVTNADITTSPPPSSTSNLPPPLPARPSKPSSSPAPKPPSPLSSLGLPLQILAGTLADTYEQLSNALSAPTSPPLAILNDNNLMRLKIAAPLVPVFLVLVFVPVAWLTSFFMLSIGLGFFGDPVIGFLGRVAEKNLGPEWKEGPSPLSSSPTNIQLTISLLRASERNDCPLPAAPPAVPPPEPTVKPMNVDEAEAYLAHDKGTGVEKADGNKASLAEFVRGAAWLTEEGAGYLSGQKKIDWESRLERVSRMAVNRLKSSTGSELPEKLMAVLPKYVALDDETLSQSTFYAHRGSVPGHLLLRANLTKTWSLEFVPLTSSSSSPTPTSTSPTSRILIPLASIVSLRKTAGWGWKGRLAKGYLMGDSVEGVGEGLEVEWAVEGERELVRFVSVMRRDQVFNRLASLGEQRWENQ